MAFEYPETHQQNAIRSMLGGESPEIPSHVGSQFSRVADMYGSEDLDKVSSTAAVPGVAPWPKANRSKQSPLYDRDVVAKALSGPVELTQTDPRQLHSSQAGITRDGVEHYMGNSYNETGETYADQGNVGNRHPVIYNKDDGRKVILSGHHRGGAALVQGRQFPARHVFGP
jgi:hypothetical protein